MALPGSSQVTFQALIATRVQKLSCFIETECVMNGVIYLVGLVVVVIAVLSFFGLR